MRNTTIVDFTDLLFYGQEKFGLSWNAFHDEVVKALHWVESDLVDVDLPLQVEGNVSENVCKVINSFGETHNLKNFELNFED